MSESSFSEADSDTYQPSQELDIADASGAYDLREVRQHALPAKRSFALLFGQGGGLDSQTSDSQYVAGLSNEIASVSTGHSESDSGSQDLDSTWDSDSYASDAATDESEMADGPGSKSDCDVSPSKAVSVGVQTDEANAVMESLGCRGCGHICDKSSAVKQTSSQLGAATTDSESKPATRSSKKVWVSKQKQIAVQMRRELEADSSNSTAATLKPEHIAPSVTVTLPAKLEPKAATTGRLPRPLARLPVKKERVWVSPPRRGVNILDIKPRITVGKTEEHTLAAFTGAPKGKARAGRLTSDSNRGSGLLANASDSKSVEPEQKPSDSEASRYLFLFDRTTKRLDAVLDGHEQGQLEVDIATISPSLWPQELRDDPSLLPLYLHQQGPSTSKSKAPYWGPFHGQREGKDVKYYMIDESDHADAGVERPAKRVRK